MSFIKLRLLVFLTAAISMSACGGGTSNSTSTESADENNDTSIASPSNESAMVMVSSNSDLTNSQQLEGAVKTGRVYFYIAEGSDWGARGVNRITYYCCKNNSSSHTVFPSVTTSSQAIEVDLANYSNGIYELYIDVFFADKYSPEPLFVSFEVKNSIVPAPNNVSPDISGTPAIQVSENSNYSFTPSANDADGDPLSFSVVNLPGWASFNSNTGQLQGVPGNADVGTYSNIIISVTDGIETVSLPQFNIVVESVPVESTGSVTLSWTPPTTYTDNSALTSLTGFNIYYGTTAGSYPNAINVSNPGLTSYFLDNLPANRTYHFVMTAYDANGVESAYSQPVSMFIP